MHKYILSVFLSVMFVVISVTGCGDSISNESDTTATEDVSELPSGNVSLRVWGAEEDADLVNQIISSFTSQYAGQATFDITFEAHSEANCKDDILGDVLNAPDVFTFADDQLMALVASGVLKKVSNDSEISSRNLAAASDAASINGTLYAYPLTADNGYFLFYNQKYLSDEDVQTMDGLLAAANKAGKQIFMEMTSGWYMYSFFGNTDMKIGLNDDGISTYCNWNATYTDITGVDVAEAMMKIGTDPAFASTSNDGFTAGAADGTFVAGVSGVWDENAIKEAWGEDYAATKLPTYTVKGQQLQLSSYAGYKLVGINSYSPNAAWAAKFADWMTNEQNQTLRFTMRGQGPSNTNASSSGEVGASKAIKALQEQAPYSSLQRVGGTYWGAATTFGEAMNTGNPSGKSLQVLLNEMVTEITGEESNGNLDESEVVEEAVEAATEASSGEEAATEASSGEGAATEASSEEAATDASGQEASVEAAPEETSEAATEAGSDSSVN